MAVYTKLTQKEVEDFISRYDVGDLESFSGIEEGIANTNYLIKTSKDRFILTIYESYTDTNELPFFISLTDHLRDRSINCPVTLKDKAGNQVQEISAKKACLISFLEGKGVTKIEDYHLSELGGKVARMHIAVKDFHQTRKNDFGLSKWTKQLSQIGEKANEIEPGLTKLIADEIYFLAANWPFGLPGGVIHGDIFPDNVFFNGEKISGIIDFYFASNDYFAYDIAIVFNAWSIHNDPKRQKLFLDAYEKIRPLTAEEKAAMPILMRGAAIRFLMSRTYDWFNTPKDAQVKKKDPLEYVEKLKSAQN